MFSIDYRLNTAADCCANHAAEWGWDGGEFPPENRGIWDLR